MIYPRNAFYIFLAGTQRNRVLGAYLYEEHIVNGGDHCTNAKAEISANSPAMAFFMLGTLYVAAPVNGTVLFVPDALEGATPPA